MTQNSRMITSWMEVRVVATMLLALLATALGPGTVTSEPLFAAPFLSFDTGSLPYSVAIGDLNGDGKPDLATANYVSTTVSVLLGNGDGSFGAKTDYDTGSNPHSVAIGDLNGDGRPDLATANEWSNTVSVLLGNGDGSFGAKTDYGTGSNPHSVAIGDLNGDGKPDLAVTNYGAYPSLGNTVSVLLGNGDGSFGTETHYGTGDSPRSVAIGDLNGDGKPDLAAANEWSNTVSVLLGNGDGSFGAKTDYATGTKPYSVAVGDLNGDSKLDLVVANEVPNTVSVLLGNGDGSFGAKTDYGTGPNPYSVAIGDLNSDGRPDLAAANRLYGTVSVLLGNGDGSFGAKTDYGTGGYPYSLAIGDLNGDGKPDLTTANECSSVSVLLGNGDGSFGVKTDYGTGGYGTSVASGDLNGDGKPDLAVANDGSTAVSVLLGNGDGSFGAKTDYGTGSSPRSVAIGDLNGDGRPDLATANWGSHTVSVLLGNGDGSFGTKTDYGTGRGPWSVAIGDLNGDGKPDLAVTNYGAYSSLGNTVSVLLGNGDGSFGAKTDYRTGDNPSGVAIGDLNGDGKPDLATPNYYDHTVSVLLGNGDGSFGATTDYGTGSYPRSVAIGDLNGDGRPDLATANWGSYTVSVLLGNGDGSFGAKTDYRTGDNPSGVAIGDLNGNGKPDLAVANYYSNAVSVLLGNGDGSFGAKTEYGTGSGPGSVAIGDLNGDGKPDLATANGGSTVSVLLNIAPPPTHTILASAGPHGSIDPSGAVAVPHGLDQTFTIMPDAYYHVAEVLVDGVSVGAVTSYTFSHVTADHTVAASFAIDTHTLSVAVLGSGTVIRSPDLPRYECGTTVELSAAPAPSWVFGGWSGDASGSEQNISLLMDGDKAVTATFCVEVVFDFKPHDLHLKSKDKWVTGYLRPPAPYLASQIDVPSIRLNGVVAVSAEHSPKLEDHDSRLKVKFSRSELIPTLVPGDHVPVTVTGLIGGLPFVGIDYIKVKAPKVHHPHAGEMLAAGTTTEVTWEPPDGPPAQSVTLLSSLDDGVTWTVEGERLANTGSCTWTVPSMATDRARVEVMLIYDTDESGVIPESEFAVSDAFSIAGPAGVEGRQASLALRPTNPVMGALTVSFSLASGAPATLAVYDIGGRQVVSREVSSSGPGWHTLRLGDLPAGVYVVRLSQSGRSLSSRVAVIR